METKMLRWTAGVTRTNRIRNDVIRQKFGVAPIANKMREARLRWANYHSFAEVSTREGIIFYVIVVHDDTFLGFTIVLLLATFERLVASWSISTYEQRYQSKVYMYFVVTVLALFVITIEGFLEGGLRKNTLNVVVPLMVCISVTSVISIMYTRPYEMPEYRTVVKCAALLFGQASGVFSFAAPLILTFRYPKFRKRCQAILFKSKRKVSDTRIVHPSQEGDIYFRQLAFALNSVQPEKKENCFKFYA
ncbi:unnamed protein product [Heligmosomoides polygyrus]|uniref:TRP domain-containing protein n=1 Tax=Heligmosomoides polygyrus TaxID=6339 RepID=A0A3P8BYD7_HELPZ|nr:unnamed protein product [Heligmosomoides polygyrus]